MPASGVRATVRGKGLEPDSQGRDGCSSGDRRCFSLSERSPPITTASQSNHTSCWDSSGMPAAVREAPSLCGANRQEANAADQEAEAGPWTQEQKE